MLSSLPATLIALLCSSLVFSQQVSRNDPFKVLALNAPKPDGRVCYLKVSTPPEPVDDDVLLSFEEWKKKQLAMQKEPPENNGGNQSSLVLTDGHTPRVGSDNAAATADTNGSTGYYYSGGIQASSEVAPHFRVPITDRFNYANLDCSSRVHGSHRSAKSPSSILSSKKDRYMLSPCNAQKEKQFVVVELCDDIRIDTVQLANFEFFSGIFKDFAVSVAKTYTTDPDGWIFAGTYRAKNVRGVQSFHPPTSLRDFYRFIRIDFLSHYGNEYYCPVSLLRVYGLTHLEEWKWDVWQAESRTKLENRPVIPAVEGAPASSVQVSVPTKSQETNDTGGSVSTTEDHSRPATSPSSETPLISALTATVTPETTHHKPDNAPLQSTSVTSSPSISVASPSDSSASISLDSPRSQDQTTPTSTTDISISVTQHTHPMASNLNSSSESGTRSLVQDANSSITIVSPTSSGPSPSIQPGPPIVHTHPILPPQPSGESIYRTIMNRLAAVENNQTLYMKYVEQQNGAMRDVIKRLGEDLGRLEGIIRAQSVVFQRTVNDWEKQRYQLQMEYGYISRRVEVLSEEIILEKRLGVAQLCLLLAVLVFLSLTRGSRAADGIVRQPSPQGLREWGRRHLSWTGHYWASKPKVTEQIVAKNDKNKSDKQNTGEIYRPKQLDLRLSGSNIFDVAHDRHESLRLPFPSSEPPLQILKPPTAVTPRRRTISNPRSIHSGSTTPLRSAPVPYGHRHGLRGAQRPATPTSRSQLISKMPHVLQRSHSLSRSVGNVERGGASLRVPTPVSQSLSWGGPLTVGLKSAKRWARTAHLHEVKTTSGKKGAKKQENVDLKRSSREDVRAKDRADNTEGDDDFFASPLERHPLSISTRLNTDGASTPSKKLSKRTLPDPDDGTDTSSPTYHLGLETLPGFTFKAPPVQDEGDPWVDTDSTGVVDSGDEFLDFL